MMKPILLDIETAALPDVMDYFDASVLDDVKAPSNYRDEVVIADYIVKRKAAIVAEHVEKAALAPDLCRIVALGIWPDETAEPMVRVCRDEEDERTALEVWWIARADRRIVGYNVVDFDLAVIIRRSLYLGVKVPPMRRGKYSYQNPDVDDLFLTLSDDFRLPWRGVSFYAKRLGIPPQPDPYTGSDVPRLAAAGDWEAIAHHCRCDLVTERAIAARLGLMSPSPYTVAAPLSALDLVSDPQ